MITIKNLETLCASINSARDQWPVPYERIDGQLVGQVGNYHISQQYGGVSLHQMMNESGGARDVFGCGHMPKRELFAMMRAYLLGVQSPRAMAVA